MLHFVPSGQIGTERDVRQPDLAIRSLRALHQQRTASIVDPQFRCVDAVPMRPLPRLQQEVDTRRKRTPADRGRLAPCFAKPPAFGMRLQVE